MKTIIAGSRTILSFDEVKKCIEMSGFKITELVSGGARGVDTSAEIYAKHNNIPFTPFNANWTVHGRSAGYKRNVEMAKYADALIAIWDGTSKGTKHMIDIAREYNLSVKVFVL